MIKNNNNKTPSRLFCLRNKTKTTPFAARALTKIHVLLLLGARLSQRVAMDDLASYFVEERSKVR